MIGRERCFDGLVAMEPELHKFYGAWSASYDQAIASKGWHMFDITFIEQLSIPVHSELVDVGGGTGRLHQSLLRHSPSKIAVIEPCVEMRKVYHDRLEHGDATSFHDSWQEYFRANPSGSFVSLFFAYSINHFSSLEHLKPLIERVDNCIILMRNPDINLIRGGVSGVHTVHAADNRVADFRHGLEAIFAWCSGGGLVLRQFREHIGSICLNDQTIRMATNFGLHFYRQ